MVFNSSVVLENRKSAVIVPLYKAKKERAECKNYRDISMLRVMGKIYVGMLVDRVRRVTEGLVDDQWVFVSGMECVDQIFTLRQVGEKAQ